MISSFITQVIIWCCYYEDAQIFPDFAVTVPSNGLQSLLLPSRKLSSLVHPSALLVLHPGFFSSFSSSPSYTIQMLSLPQDSLLGTLVYFTHS